MPYDAATYTETNTVADVLRRAKALIDTPEKWRKCGGEDDGKHCSAQAIFNQFPLGDQEQTAETAARFLRQAIGVGFISWASIFEWNDAPERTHAEVLAVFDAAIALAERGA